MKARAPSFPLQYVQKLHYGESFAAERLQTLKKARLFAQQHTADQGENYKLQFDKNALPHDYKGGESDVGTASSKFSSSGYTLVFKEDFSRIKCLM